MSKAPAQKQKSREGAKTRPKPSDGGSTPTPPRSGVLEVDVVLDEPEDRRREAARLYRLVTAGEMDSSEACRRLHMLSVMHTMQGSEALKMVQKLEKRLIEANLLPKALAAIHEQ